jgi:hypothetical protein
MKYLDAQQQFL